MLEEKIVMPVGRALGVIWDTESDCFVEKVVKRDLADTRRKNPSLIASLFDPTDFPAGPIPGESKTFPATSVAIWYWLGLEAFTRIPIGVVEMGERVGWSFRFLVPQFYRQLYSCMCLGT